MTHVIHDDDEESVRDVDADKVSSLRFDPESHERETRSDFGFGERCEWDMTQKHYFEEPIPLVHYSSPSTSRSQS